MRELRSAPVNLPNALAQFIDLRKSGLSLNHVIGCPLDCGYCVRHLFQNFDMKQPHAITTDEDAVEQLVSHWAFRRNHTPIQIFNRATDPFLPGVKERLFSTLRLLDAQGLTNLVLIITRWHISREDVEWLEGLSHLRVTILVTWSGIEDRRIEPVDSSIAADSLRVLNANAERTKAIFYWRPLISGLNDTPSHLEQAAHLSGLASATVFTGLFFRDEIRDYFRAAGVPDLYDEVMRRKILPQALEHAVLRRLTGGNVFRKTSCAVSYVHGSADYNGHFGIQELCDICPESQRKLCEISHRKPESALVHSLARSVGLDVESIVVKDDRIEVSGSTEQQRYYVQHALNFQVHDRAHPHFVERHGRAEVGWK